jgi:hypothetical protein
VLLQYTRTAICTITVPQHRHQYGYSTALPPVLLQYNITCTVTVTQHQQLYCYSTTALPPVLLQYHNTTTCIVTIPQHSHLYCYSTTGPPPVLLQHHCNTELLHNTTGRHGITCRRTTVTVCTITVLQLLGGHLNYSQESEVQQDHIPWRHQLSLQLKLCCTLLAAPEAAGCSLA